MAVAPKRCDLDDFTTEPHMRQTEPAPDQTTVAECRPHILWRRIGGHVEILRVIAEQQIAHAAAHKVGLIAT